MMKSFKINPEETVAKLANFIAKAANSKGFFKVILGLSGGLDSTVVAYLSQKALGEKNVIGVIMPYGELSRVSVQDANRVAKKLNIETECVDIKPMIDVYFNKVNAADNIRRGNKMARERMSILYDLSKEYDALVIGTSNKTERLLGYTTIYGDSACAINPIGNFYKTQLKVIAKYLGVPSNIIDKVPTADLWSGQTDEDELGYRYKDIDKLLFLMIDKKIDNKKLIKTGFSRKFISDIENRIRSNRFKQQPPLIAKI